ncbi:Branched-chain amino acid ABC transporter permease OS=Castellaniella sp OX=1955812 GN=EPN31_01105 PE=4 SV=1 [Castellaniella denitrificans]|uniref:branched-chain amino acid ABC transporter permease n=1 Tax=Castellaniella sp. TaxID=1955812 RepID=UPI002AFEC434|nr:branched-chain amino acid ABC transporter permease [Castellaniella sp.]
MATHMTSRAAYPRASAAIGWIALLAAVFTAPLYLDNQYDIRLAVLVCLLGSASIGWNLLGGYANQISLGHITFFGIGMYTVAIFQTSLQLSPWLAIPVAVVLSLAVAVLIGWPSFRLSGHYFALATLALLPVSELIASGWESLTGGARGLSIPILPSGLSTLQFDEPEPFFYVSAVFLVIVLAIARIVRFSTLGMRLSAIRSNPEAATLAGVDQFRTKMATLLISAAIVAVAGALYGAFLQYVDPRTAFAWDTTLNLVLFAIVGGLQFWWGPLLGAVILIPINEYASMQLSGNLAALGQLAYGLILLLLIIFQPRGLGGLLQAAFQQFEGRARK